MILYIVMGAACTIFVHKQQLKPLISPLTHPNHPKIYLYLPIKQTQKPINPPTKALSYP